RATIANRVEYRRVIASEAPAAVHQAWTDETKAARAVASVAVHDVEKDFPLAGNIRISANGFRGFVSRCNAGRRGQHGHHHAAHAAHSANTHTMPPWLVYRERSGAKSARGRTSAGSSERMSPAIKNQSPPIPA